MKPSITQNRLELAKVQLALKAAGEPAAAVGKSPDLEELCALRDGQLDDTRRAQVLAYVADDEQVYQQWLRVLDANPLIAEQASAGTVAAPTESWGSRFGSLFGARAPWAFGSAIAAVFAVSVIVQTPKLASVDHPELDQLYSDYATSWSASPDSLPALATRSSQSVKQASAAKQALFVGAEEGLRELGTEFPSTWLPLIDVDPDTVSDIEPDLFASLHSSGKLSTLSHFKCQLDGEPEFFNRTSAVLDELQTSLLNQSGELALTLAESLAVQQPAKDKVCGFARLVVAELHKK